ncbi:MAG: hypothetical protein DRQ55_11325 [Planctomycetota bacterium]|nr:MAG: hypothetical protein DRQ55_11325 [Planctomycetota bacterium]
MIAVVLLAALSLALPAAEIVRLVDGSLVHGEITSFDEATGITLERVDTGGVLTLVWGHLPPDEVKRIKASRGFTGEEAAPWMVDVVHLIMRNGTTETGVLQPESDVTAYVLRRRGSSDRFPRSSVRSVEPGKVEGLSVLSAEELYLAIVASLGAPSDAPAHLELAIACEGAKLYDAARDHFLTVRELGPGLKAELVASRLSRIAIKLEDAVETADLDDIRSAIYRRQFELARERAAAFAQTYPESRQRGELMALEVEIDHRKREHFARKVVGDYFGALEGHLKQLSRDSSLSLDVARDLLENSLHQEILDDLAEAYVMTPEAVAQLWEQRRGGSVRTASYGQGTFLLGKSKALDFGRFDQADEEVDPADELEEDFDDLVAKVKKQREALAQQRTTAARGGGLDEVGPTPDEWWEAAEGDARRSWMAAYYAEFSGAIHVIEAKPRDCRRCDAGGYIEGTNEKSEPVLLTCPVCKGLKRERVVRAR